MTDRLSLWLTAWAIGAGVHVSAAQADPEMLAHGEKLYQENCSVCHGDRGDGKTWAQRSLDPSPADFTSDAMRAHLDAATLFAHISEGCHGTAMQPFKYQLYEDERRAIATHILVNILHKEAAEAAADDHAGAHHHQDQAQAHDHGTSGGAAGAGASECKPWDLGGVKTVAVKTARPE